MPAEKDVVVKVGGDTSALQTEMHKGGKSVRTFGQRSRTQLKETAKSMAKVTAAAALAGGAIVAAFGRKTLQAADNIGKFADRIGISTRALQKYRFAFDLAGVAQEETDKGLLTFSKRIGEARAGTGAMVDVLRRINPELLELIRNAKSEDEALKLVFNAMGKATRAADKNAIANAALGRAGVKMTAAFKDGAAAFFEATREAERLGLVIDEKLIRNAEQLNDDFTRATGIIGTQLKNAFLELAPAINKAVNSLSDFLLLARESRVLNIGLSDNPSFEESARFLDAEINRVERFIESLEDGKTSIFGFEFDISKDAEQLKQVRMELAALKQIRQSLVKPKEPVKLTGGNKPLEPLDSKKKLTEEERKALQIAERRKQVLLDILDPMRKLTEFQKDANSQVNDFNPNKISQAQANQAIAEKAQQMGLNLGGQQFGKDDPERNEAFLLQMQERLEFIQDFVKSEEELELESHLRRLQELNKFKDEFLLTEDERRALQLDLEQKHHDAMVEIRKRGLTDLEKFNAKSFKDQTSTVLGEMVNMTSGVARENKAMFEINKQAATGQAIIDGISAVMKTMSQYPFPISIAMAGLQAAANVAQISAIQSQTFGGGGSAPSLAGSTAAVPVSDVGLSGQGPEQNSTIILQGDFFGPDVIRKLAKELNEGRKNGTRLVVA